MIRDALAAVGGVFLVILFIAFALIPCVAGWRALLADREQCPAIHTTVKP